MYEKLEKRTALFGENYTVLKKTLKLQSAEMLTAAALVYALKDSKADPQRLKECKQTLKDGAGVLSVFRSTSEPLVLTHMALHNDPECSLDEIRQVYAALSKGKIIDSEYALCAAMILAEKTCSANREAYIRQTEELYVQMKENFSIGSKGEALPAAAMLAAADADAKSILQDAAECSALLKKIAGKNERQSLSAVLALSPASPQEKCEKVKNILDLLKQKKHKYDKNCGLTVLGALALTDLAAEEIAEQIIFADDQIKKDKSFGAVVGIREALRRLYAAALVFSVNKENVGEINAADSVSIAAVLEAVEMEVIVALNVSTQAMLAASAAVH